MPRFELKGKLALDGSQWGAGLKQAEGKAARFSKNVSSSFKGAFLGAFGTAAITAAMKGLIDKAGNIKATADQLGLTAEQVQVLSETLKEGGATLEDFSGAQRGLANSMKAAADGSALAADKFLKFGIGIQDIKRMNPTEMMFALATQIQKGSGSFTELADAQALAGEQMAKLLPIMHSGLGVLSDDFERFGVMSGETVDNLATLGNQMASTFNKAAPFLATFIALFDTFFTVTTRGFAVLGATLGAGTSGVAKKHAKPFVEQVFDQGASDVSNSWEMLKRTAMANVSGVNVQGINPPGIQGADQAQRYEKWQRDMAKDIALIRKEMESATR